MTPEYCITEWRQQVPWVEDYQVEQDLIISRALVSLYENPKIKENLVFRGGTARKFPEICMEIIDDLLLKN